MRYGQEIKWTRFNGAKSFVSCFNCESIEIAQEQALKSAKQAGWTPPKWWQWWRWKDTRI